MQARTIEIQKITRCPRRKIIELKRSFEKKSRFDNTSLEGNQKHSYPFDVYDCIGDYYSNLNIEEMRALVYDGNQNLIGNLFIENGDGHEICLKSMRKLFSSVFAVPKAHSFVLTHNHPNSDPTPSCDDINSTQKVHTASSYCGVILRDHIIFGLHSEKYQNGYCSMNTEGYLHP